MMFVDLMNAFAKDAKLEELAPNDKGVYQLDIDGMIVAITEVNDGKKLACCSEICELPPEGDTSLYRLMLETMYMGMGTGGAVLSIEHDTSKVFLHEIESMADMNLDAFKQLLENFVNHLEEWRDRIQEFRTIEPALEEAKEQNIIDLRNMSLGMNGFIKI